MWNTERAEGLLACCPEEFMPAGLSGQIACLVSKHCQGIWFWLVQLKRLVCP